MLYLLNSSNCKTVVRSGLRANSELSLETRVNFNTFGVFFVPIVKNLAFLPCMMLYSIQYCPIFGSYVLFHTISEAKTTAEQLWTVTGCFSSDFVRLCSAHIFPAGYH